LGGREKRALSNLETLGQTDGMDRDLYLLCVEQSAELQSEVVLPSSHFVCLLVWNADKVTDYEIERVATIILHSGAAYVCVWGRACERVHDVFDRVFVESNVADQFTPSVMTTWHAAEQLTAAIWYAMFSAFPDDAYAETCRATLAIVIGAADNAEVVRGAFGDPGGFSEQILSER
jgi:hypothetical protein